MLNSLGANEVVANNRTPVITWCTSWGEYAMNILWSEIASTLVQDEVHNIVQLAERVTIHWTRSKCNEITCLRISLHVLLCNELITKIQFRYQ
jgi:hypothetical protein